MVYVVELMGLEVLVNVVNITGLLAVVNLMEKRSRKDRRNK